MLKKKKKTEAAKSSFLPLLDALAPTIVETNPFIQTAGLQECHIPSRL